MLCFSQAPRIMKYSANVHTLGCIATAKMAALSYFDQSHAVKMISIKMLISEMKQIIAVKWMKTNKATKTLYYRELHVSISCFFVCLFLFCLIVNKRNKNNSVLSTNGIKQVK